MGDGKGYFPPHPYTEGYSFFSPELILLFLVYEKWLRAQEPSLLVITSPCWIKIMHKIAYLVTVTNLVSLIYR